MGSVVCTLGVPHTPLLWRLLADETPDDLVHVVARFEQFRDLLEESRPDAIVLVATDHFRQHTTANMPAFLVGKAPQMLGTHPNEERHFGLPRKVIPGAPDIATAILGTHELAGSFDFAFTDEPWLDHAYMVPLLYLTPELDIPVVPVNTNCNAPPIPTARRFAELGRFLRDRIQGAPEPARVAVVVSGHLSYELGGPRQFAGVSPGPDFDEEAIGWVAAGDVEAAIEGATFDRMLQAGNLTFQFLNFIAAMTVVGGAPATIAEGIACRFGTEPFFAWSAG